MSMHIQQHIIQDDQIARNVNKQRNYLPQMSVNPPIIPNQQTSTSTQNSIQSKTQGPAPENGKINFNNIRSFKKFFKVEHFCFIFLMGGI